MIDYTLNIGGIVYGFFPESTSKKLSDLIPIHSPLTNQGQAEKQLVNYYFLLKSLRSTIEFLEKGELSKFDALICENLCQVRAVTIPLILPETLKTMFDKNRDLKSKVETAIQIIERLQSTKKGKNFDLNKDLEIELTATELFFVELFILSYVKKRTDGDEEITDRKKLRDIAPVVDKFTDRLVKNLRTEVSKVSAPFLQNLAELLGDMPSLRILENNILWIKDRECTPYYWTTKIIVQAIQHFQIPVVLWVKQENKHKLIFKEFCISYESIGKGEFVIKPPLLTHANRPGIVVQAICRRNEKNMGNREISIREVRSFKLVDLLLSHGAIHPPYPSQFANIIDDKTIEIKTFGNTLDTSYQDYKQKAIEWKCSKDNPQLLSIYHIYCDLLGNVKPLKYEIHAYLKVTYGNFYLSCERVKIKEMLTEMNINANVEILNKEFIIRLNNIEDYGCIILDDDTPWWRRYRTSGSWRRDLFEIFFHKVAEVPSHVFSTDSQVILKMSIDWNDLPNLLHLAQYHENPVKFLVDHRSLWKNEFIPEYLDFLTATPENFREPELMDILADMIQSPGHRYLTIGWEQKEQTKFLESIILGISRALQVPELEDRVKDLLVDTASKYECEKHGKGWFDFLEKGYVETRRKLARVVLATLLPNQEVFGIMKEMYHQETDVALQKLSLLPLLAPETFLVHAFKNNAFDDVEKLFDFVPQDMNYFRRSTYYLQSYQNAKKLAQKT